MTEQSIDHAASAASSGTADIGEGQGLAAPDTHAGGTVPGDGPASGDVLRPAVDGIEDAVTADTEGAQQLQRQTAIASTDR